MNQTNSSNAITQLTTKMERGELGKKADGPSSFSLVFMMLIIIFIIFVGIRKNMAYEINVGATLLLQVVNEVMSSTIHGG